MYKKLKILLVTLYIDIGGLEKLLFEMGGFLLLHGYEVEILCLRSVDQAYIDNISSYNIPIHVMRKKGRMDFGFHYRVARFIREKNFDIIHAHSGCFWDAALFTLLAGCKRYIYTAHGIPFEHGLKSRFEDIIAGFIVDKVVAVSTEINEVHRARLVFNKEKVITVINGVNTDVFMPLCMEEKKIFLDKYSLPEGYFFVGSVGRLAKEKNYQMLITAFAKIVQYDNNSPIGLVLVGGGAMESELRALASRLGVRDKVFFLGICYEVQKVVALLDVFVLSSLTEGTSISLLEAQACGVPAIVTDVGGNSNIIDHGKNGFLCTVDDFDQMAEQMLRFVDDSRLLSECSRNARQRVVQNFSLQAMMGHYINIYHNNF